MKLQAQRTAAAKPVRSRKKDQKSWAAKLYILVYLLATVSIIFAVANYRIDLDRKIKNLQKSTNRAKQEIYELERDIQALKNKREQLTSWSNVRSQIARYNLPFRAADHRQIRMLTVRSYRSVPLANEEHFQKKNLSLAR